MRFKKSFALALLLVIPVLGISDDKPIKIYLINDVFDTEKNAKSELANLHWLMQEIYVTDVLNPNVTSIPLEYSNTYNIGGRGEGSFNDFFLENAAFESLTPEARELIDLELDRFRDKYPGLELANASGLLNSEERSSITNNLISFVASNNPVSRVLEPLFSGLAKLFQSGTAVRINEISGSDCAVMFSVGATGGVMALNIYAALDGENSEGTLSIVELGNKVGREDLVVIKEGIDRANRSCNPAEFTITSVIADDNDLVINRNFSWTETNPGGVYYEADILYEGNPEFPITISATILPDTRYIAGHCGRDDNCTLVKEFDAPTHLPPAIPFVSLDGFYCEGWSLWDPIPQTFDYVITDASGVSTDTFRHTHYCDYFF